MPETIVFYTNLPVEETLLENFISGHLIQSDFVWTNNFYEFAAEHEIDNQKTYISVETLSSHGLKYQYSVFNNFDFGPGLRERVEILQQLAALAKIDIFSDDDEINPWTLILIEPNGQTSTIQLPNNSLFNHYECYNFPFGAFRSKTKLTDNELKIVKQMIAGYCSDTEIHHGYDGPMIDGDFDTVKENIVELQLFNNHYDIIPRGKNEWLDKNEKSELFIHLMSLFVQKTNNDLCLFPSNYSEVKNIEGGSDTEEYCMIITPEKVQKIIYNQRRKSWLS